MLCKFCHFDLGEQTICPQCGASQPGSTPARSGQGNGSRFQDLFPLLFGIGCALIMLFLSGLWLSTDMAREPLGQVSGSLRKEGAALVPERTAHSEKSIVLLDPAREEMRGAPLPDLSSQSLLAFELSPPVPPAESEAPSRPRPKAAPSKRRFPRQTLAQKRSAPAMVLSDSSDPLPSPSAPVAAPAHTQHPSPPAKRDPTLDGLKWIESLRWLG
ncbi:MAG: hypothetical protein LBO00_07835 [Zoogloeaceae bacterium]|nr:hypothetical protein [Zoogloeaceae bacterium]